MTVPDLTTSCWTRLDVLNACYVHLKLFRQLSFTVTVDHRLCFALICLRTEVSDGNVAPTCMNQLTLSFMHCSIDHGTLVAHVTDPRFPRKVTNLVTIHHLRLQAITHKWA